MDPERFRGSPAGRVMRTPKGYWAFVPNPLPPKIAYSPELASLLSRASQALGELSGLGSRLPNPHLLVAPYIRREAVLSSQIEGTQSSLSDLLLFEATEDARRVLPDVLEVRNYVNAMSYGLDRLADLPLSLRLVRELHRELMGGVRGEDKTPGEFRRSPNWIGGANPSDAEFVPPPPDQMLEAIGDWEKFLHSENVIPPLVACALLHYQFEAIHPFLDGNGRIGRLLITLFLCERGCLSQPLLYLSAFFVKNRDEYCRWLMRVSESGDWGGWISFFLRGVAEQASDASACSQRVLGLLDSTRERLQAHGATLTALLLLEHVFQNPFVTIPGVKRKLDVSYPTAKSAVECLEAARILAVLDDTRRPKTFWSEELFKVVGGEREES